MRSKILGFLGIVLGVNVISFVLYMLNVYMTIIYGMDSAIVPAICVVVGIVILLIIYSRSSSKVNMKWKEYVEVYPDKSEKFISVWTMFMFAVVFGGLPVGLVRWISTPDAYLNVALAIYVFYGFMLLFVTVLIYVRFYWWASRTKNSTYSIKVSVVRVRNDNGYLCQILNDATGGIIAERVIDSDSPVDAMASMYENFDDYICHKLPQKVSM